MVHRPLPATNPCPNCGEQPKVRLTIFKGARAVCECGVAGPFVKGSDWPHHDALAKWSIVAGNPARPRPPSPITTLPPGARFEPLHDYRIAKLQLAPGDVAVIKIDAFITDDQARHIKGYAEAALPAGTKTLILDRATDLSVLTASDLAKRLAGADGVA